jgi:hypothetical protein
LFNVINVINVDFYQYLSLFYRPSVNSPGPFFFSGSTRSISGKAAGTQFNRRRLRKMQARGKDA